MKTSVAIATVLGALMFGAGAHAQVLFNNLGARSAGTDPVAGFGPLADSFSTGANPVTLSTIKVLIQGTPDGSGDTEIALMSDNNTSPGAVIASGFFSDGSTSATLTPLTATGSIPLAANTRYWIELSSVNSSSVLWSYSYDLSGVGVAGEYFSNSTGVTSNADGAYQMEVLGSVPEPATWTMMVMGLGALGGVMRRRARRAVAV